MARLATVSITSRHGCNFCTSGQADKLVEGSEKHFDAADGEFEIASGFQREMLESIAPALQPPANGATCCAASGHTLEGDGDA